MEVEQGGFAPPTPSHLPPPGLGGAGGGDRSKEKGKGLDLGASSSQDGAVQSPTKKVNSSTRGKG
jgi:hypothetical protein